MKLRKLAAVLMAAASLSVSSFAPVSAGAVTEPVEGDVSGDGAFNVSDVVLFQRWLLAAPDTELADWKAADLSGDGVLNAYDLVLMRRKLTGDVSERTLPILVVEEGASWRQQQYLIVYDDKGTAYRRILSGGQAAYSETDSTHIDTDVPYLRFTGEGWYETLEDIISRPYARYGELKMDEEMLADTKVVSAKTEELSSEKWLKEATHWWDGNTMTIYSVCRGESGEPHCAKLCTLLATDSCLDNKEVQDFVMELCKKGYVDYPDLDTGFKTYLEYYSKAE
jgi:hypothetical protein